MSQTAALYVRQSVDRAEGIDRQLARCRALATARGWEVVAEFEDNAVSAFKSRGAGTAWARLLASDAEVVVSVNLDRLLRGQADLLALVASGKTVATVEGDLDLTTAEGQFRAELLTSLAQFEVRRKGERQTRANESRVEKGLPVPGKRRFGFKPGNVEEEPEEADALRWAYQQLLAGRSLWSMRERFGRAPVRIGEILRNPSYAGWVVRGGERFEAHESVARIVDRDIWEAAQDLLGAEGRRVSPGPARKHLMSGIAKCECGAGMRALSVYYKCSADNSHATLYRADLDKHVARRLAAVLLNDDTAAEIPAPLAKRLADLEAERTRWTAVAALPGADVTAAGRELARIDREATEAAEALGRARVSAVAADAVDRARALVQKIATESHTMDATWADEWVTHFEGLPLDERRGLVESRLTVTVAKGRGLGRVTVTKR